MSSILAYARCTPFTVVANSVMDYVPSSYSSAATEENGTETYDGPSVKDELADAFGDLITLQAEALNPESRRPTCLRCWWGQLHEANASSPPRGPLPFWLSDCHVLIKEQNNVVTCWNRDGARRGRIWAIKASHLQLSSHVVAPRRCVSVPFSHRNRWKSQHLCTLCSILQK